MEDLNDPFWISDLISINLNKVGEFEENRATGRGGGVR